MKYEITAPDGRRFEVTAPEGATQEQVLAFAQQNFGAPQTTAAGMAAEAGKGLLRGASDVAGGVRQAVTSALLGPVAGPMLDRAFGSLVQGKEQVQATPATEAERFAGTAGEIAGAGAAGGGLTSLPAAALTGATAVTGAVGEQIGGETGKLIGTVIPAAASAVKPLAEAGAKSLMQSAIKPTIKDLGSGKAAKAVETLLEEGISPTNKGILELRYKITQLKGQVAEAIKNSPATINKREVGKELNGTLDKFSKQVDAKADIETIRKTWDNFINHPLLKDEEIPVQLAQEMKQGTYAVLDKKYGQLGSAETEAQKSLARGLKVEIEKAVPEVIGLNAQESRLINALKVSERRALMELNKNPAGLAFLSSHPAAALGFMADRSAAFKALVARMIHGAQKGIVDPSKAVAIVGAENAP